MRSLVAVLVLTANAVAAQPMLGNADRGRDMAIDVCAECHSVELSPEIESASAPRSFTAIARDPIYTETSLRVFFSSPHVQMPDFIFSREQQDDLIAYLMEMRAALEEQ